MVNSVELFLKVNEKATREHSLLHVCLNFIRYIKHCVFSRAIVTKAVQRLVENVVLVEKLFQSTIHADKRLNGL